MIWNRSKDTNAERRTKDVQTREQRHRKTWKRSHEHERKETERFIKGVRFVGDSFSVLPWRCPSYPSFFNTASQQPKPRKGLNALTQPPVSSRSNPPPYPSKSLRQRESIDKESKRGERETTKQRREKDTLRNKGKNTKAHQRPCFLFFLSFLLVSCSHRSHLAPLFLHGCIFPLPLFPSPVCLLASAPLHLVYS